MLAYQVIAAASWVARMRWAGRYGRLPIVSQRQTADGVGIDLAGRVDLRWVGVVAFASVAALALILLWTARG